MNKKLITLATITTVCTMLILPFNKSFAKGQTVKTTLPSFTVSLNENEVESKNRQFPILVYKDITYFPMTWYDSRLLGIETEWSNESGLNIDQKKITSSFNLYASKSKNNKVQYAEILDSKVKLNGKEIDNSREKYPLLKFRDVTYFPLTWRFAHDEFNWSYDWDKTRGLSINSKNKKLNNSGLPKYAGQNGVAIYEGYYYFVETVDNINTIYRRPKGNSSVKELVYSYDINSGYGPHKGLSFEMRGEALWFKYHHGGAVMGYDFYGKIDKDGKVSEEHSGYLNFIETDYGTVVSSQGPMPDHGNLKLVPKGKSDTDSTMIGSPNIYYVNEMFSLGENIYVLGSENPFENERSTNLYKVNILTHEHLKVIDSEIDSFKLMNNKLYYVKNADKHLYTSNIDGSDEKKVSNRTIDTYNNWYGELNGNVYYVASNNEGRKNLYVWEQGEKDRLLLEEEIDTIEIMDDKIIAKLVNGGDYGMKIFDSNGQLILTVTDDIYDFFAYQDDIIVTLEKDKSVKLLK